MGRGPAREAVPPDHPAGPGGDAGDGPPPRRHEENHVPVDGGPRGPGPRGDPPEPDARGAVPRGLHERVPRGPPERGPDAREADRGAEEAPRRVRRRRGGDSNSRGLAATAWLGGGGRPAPGPSP